MTFITHLVMDRLKAHLTDHLITRVGKTDLSRADLVKIGRFQDNPTVKNMYVAISQGDPEDPAYKDGVLGLESLPQLSMQIPVYELGGGAIWMRRGVLQVGAYLLGMKLDEEKANEIAGEFLGRILAHIEDLEISDLEDSYGEQAIRMVCYANTFAESGGPPNSYIYRGKVFWGFLSNRPG